MRITHLRQFILAAEEVSSGNSSGYPAKGSAQLAEFSELEAFLGARLFRQERRAMRLTVAGKLFLQDARRLVAMFEQAQLSAQSVESEPDCVLRVALSHGLGPEYFAGMLGQLHEDEPEVQVRFFEVSREQQLAGLHQHAYDLGFARSPADGEGLLSVPFWDDSLLVVIPGLHPLAPRTQVDIECLPDFPLLLQCSLRDWQVRTVLGARQGGGRPVEYVSSAEMLLSLVNAGYGVGILRQADLKANHRSGLVVRPLVSYVARESDTTWLLHCEAVPAPHIQRFIYRLATYFARA
ncbi:hypothetical protein JVX91_24265 [Pseudomonas sp. PDNC002]|uniref:LysR family transcriptional regulator n=1 Tax=Pseudomonas sp. PDNC002 TaxID=2811422 RepID=UPI00196345EF|nr:LysR family transcriptional regulator [Pseudomonas sp. PDNC002]QRY78666.1 hypothetical protein JVX91_24265 [Pseudomonas sp. PDNC002]